MITQEQIEVKQKEAEDKASELSQSLNLKIQPVIFLEDEEIIVGFMREPDRNTKTMYLDMAQMKGLASASSQLVELLLLKEGDYERILKNDNHFFGACGKVNQMIQASQDQFKKK